MPQLCNCEDLQYFRMMCDNKLSVFRGPHSSFGAEQAI